MSHFSEILEKLAIVEGFNQTYLPGVQIYKSSKCLPRTPMEYKPSIIILGKGQKNISFNHKSISYDSEHYLVLSAPMQYECETLVSEGENLTALRIEIDMSLLNELLEKICNHHIDGVCPKQATKVGIHSIPLKENIQESVLQLAQALQSQEEIDILGKNLVREILYRVLKDKQVPSLYALAQNDSKFARIAKVLRHIHNHYMETISIENLAKDANMSDASFYRFFKDVTLLSPLQYIKNIRLGKARELMTYHKLTSKEASKKVGYESVSQFSREFKRYFGKSPREEVKN